MIIIGEVNTMTVLRKTDIGYMLKNENDEVFLHANETNHQILEDGQTVFAFLYFDQKGRLAATLKTPLITVSKNAFLEVKDVLPNLGVFLDMGILKDVLLSKDDLPLNVKEWPQPKDKLYVSLYVKGKLVAKRVPNNQITVKNASSLTIKDEVEGYISKIGKDGINIVTENLEVIFVHHSMAKGTYRLGQSVNVKITFLSDKGYTGSLIAQKEVQIYDDANQILSFLIRKGTMDLTSDSDKDDIYEVFKMSKKAFKRALGHLYKERKIDFVDNKTVLVK